MSNGKVFSCSGRERGRPGNRDDNRRFLSDLRALRNTAALDFDELAARAHYPTDVLKEAESGPALPGLPILAAYVRACDGDVPEWEERWRRLSLEAEADPGLRVRPAGASPAAVAWSARGGQRGPARGVRRGADQGGAAQLRPVARPRVPTGADAGAGGPRPGATVPGWLPHRRGSRRARQAGTRGRTGTRPRAGIPLGPPLAGTTGTGRMRVRWTPPRAGRVPQRPARDVG